MNNIARGQDSGAKKEADIPKSCPSRITPASSRQWSSSFKNPRIVRVSRAFGGKDRHSKVCTVRGLRDRRIRLSVPTAIQLYDLQDRLGLSMPSKVVDWLIEAAKQEIDKLPPLPVIPSSFSHFHEPSTLSLSSFLAPHEATKMSEKESVLERSKWINESQHEEQGFGGIVAQLSAQNFFPAVSNQFPVPNMPYNSNYFHWEPPNLSLSQFGGGYAFPNQTEEQSSQINMAPHFPSYIPQSMDSDHYFRQMQQNPVSPTTLRFISKNPPHEEEDRNREKQHDRSCKGQVKFLH